MAADHAAAALEQLRKAHLKLVAADSHLRLTDDVSCQVRLHAISADLARLILQLEPEREPPVLESEVEIRPIREATASELASLAEQEYEERVARAGDGPLSTDGGD